MDLFHFRGIHVSDFYAVHTYQIGSQVVVVRVLQELLQEGHEITEHIAVGPGQLGDELSGGGNHNT